MLLRLGRTASHLARTRAWQGRKRVGPICTQKIEAARTCVQKRGRGTDAKEQNASHGNGNVSGMLWPCASPAPVGDSADFFPRAAHSHRQLQQQRWVHVKEQITGSSSPAA